MSDSGTSIAAIGLTLAALATGPLETKDRRFIHLPKKHLSLQLLAL
jgi:hypothetical protein